MWVRTPNLNSCFSGSPAPTPPHPQLTPSSSLLGNTGLNSPKCILLWLAVVVSRGGGDTARAEEGGLLPVRRQLGSEHLNLTTKVYSGATIKLSRVAGCYEKLLSEEFSFFETKTKNKQTNRKQEGLARSCSQPTLGPPNGNPGKIIFFFP